MWEVREKGPVWFSVVAAWVLAGLGLSHAVAHLITDSLDYRVWLYWARGFAIWAVQFLGTMLLIHGAAVAVWWGGLDPRDKERKNNPPMSAGMGTLMRLGGYWYLPTAAIGLLLNLLIYAAVKAGSPVAVKAAVVGVMPLAIAGYVWVAIFRLRMLRTVYLVTWSQAIGMGLIILLLGGFANGIYRQGIVAPDAAIATVSWDLHRALGANPRVIEALESIPQANSQLRVSPLHGAPSPGDLVAYYRDREAPQLRKGVRLPKPIVIGRVLPGTGGEGVLGTGDAGLERVPEDSVLIRPVGIIEGLVPEVVPLRFVAGRVPESDLQLMIWIVRLMR
jgi:hypothetical protein